MGRRIAFVFGCIVIFGIAVSVPDTVSSPGDGETAVTIHLDHRVDACGRERTEVPDADVGIWVRQDPMPSDWTDSVSGVLVWSDERAVFTAEDGTELRYRFEHGQMDCTWG